MEVAVPFGEIGVNAPETVLRGRPGSGLGKFAGTELPDSAESKDVSKAVTVADQMGGKWNPDHLPRALRQEHLPKPPKSREELTLDQETFVWLTGANDPNGGDYALTIASKQRLMDGKGGWLVLPARTIGFGQPGCRYTTPSLGEFEALQYGFFRGQGKKDTVARKLAHEAAVEDLIDLKWAIWNSDEGRCQKVVPLAVAQAPKPQALQQHIAALGAAGLDVDKFLKWQAEQNEKTDEAAKPKAEEE